jgi:hypothetical protein
MQHARVRAPRQDQFNPKSYGKEQKRLTAGIIGTGEPSRRSYFHGFTPLLEANPELAAHMPPYSEAGSIFRTGLS